MPISDVASSALQITDAAAQSTSPSSSDSSAQIEHDSQVQTPTRYSSVVNPAETPDVAPSSSASSSKTDASNPEAEKHPKGKRKRTAAKDKTVLENAYIENPKPDKAARLDIVKRVSLNEKEVQIWFQNRRQNDRRKSRPLSAQEIAALRYGGMQILSSDPVAYSSPVVDETAISTAAEGPSRAIYLHTETPSRQAAPTPEAFGTISPAFSPPNAPTAAADVTLETPARVTHARPSHSASLSFSGSIGDLPARWSFSTSYSTPPSSSLNRTMKEIHKPDQYQPSSCSSTASVTNALPPSQSHMRLSLSLEGKAELVPNDASPPESRSEELLLEAASFPHQRSRSFQRSHSARAGVTLPPISSLTDSLPPTLGRGRSRDAHAWELCCDADARDELTAQAEDESNGSAVAAISLLRSTSSVLQSNSSKRNSPASKPASRLQQAKRPKLSRTSSSVARMQTSARDGDNVEMYGIDGERPGTKSKGLMNFVVSPSGDSDKENWVPKGECNGGSVASAHEVQKAEQLMGVGRGNSRRAGRVLQGHHGPAVFGSSRAKTMPAMGRRDSGKGLSIFEDREGSPAPKASDEVERFMRGEVSPSKKGDMDCIAGLLSLSQGNWR